MIRNQVYELSEEPHIRVLKPQPFYLNTAITTETNRNAPEEQVYETLNIEPRGVLDRAKTEKRKEDRDKDTLRLESAGRSAQKTNNLHETLTHEPAGRSVLPETKTRQPITLKVLIVLTVISSLAVIGLAIYVAVITHDVDGSWSGWTVWVQCSVTCDTGIETRERTCSNPKPKRGGNHCYGENKDYRICNNIPCTVIDGSWSGWTVWGQCSVTCDTGMETRERTCLNPKPKRGGNHCYGENKDYRICNNIPCTVNGYWAGWNEWSRCSVTCGGALRSRSRSCFIQTPGATGTHCLGSSTESRSCGPSQCPTFQVRLVGNSTTGRLEVSLNGSIWGTVCDDHFDDNDARVVCKMLGYQRSGIALENDQISEGSGPIFLDELGCLGYEDSLFNCKHNGWGNEDCDHDEDVGVSCK